MIYSYRTPERDAGAIASDYAMSRSAAAFCVWITSLRHIWFSLYNGCMKRILSFVFWVAFFFSAAFLSLAVESIIKL